MAEIQIPNVRQESTVLLHALLKDNGVAVDWAGLEDIKAFFFSDAQQVIAGRCEVAVGGANSTVLDVIYPATRPQYQGVNSLLVRCTYQGREKTFDLPVVNFVPRTAQATGVTVLDDPEIDVELKVSEVSTSLLDGAIAAALDAAALAGEAAGKQPVIRDNNHWFIWDAAQGEYVDSGVVALGVDGRDGKSPYIGDNGNWLVYSDETDAWIDTGVEAQGPEGPRGMAGGILYPTFSVDAAMHLQMDTHEDTGADRFALNDAGHLTVEV